VAGMAAVVFGAMSIAGISHADDGAGGPHHHGMGMHGEMDPAKAEKRIERMVNRILPDGTAEQKTKVSAIAKAAMNDLRPLHEKLRATRMESMKILAQPNIDRSALERNRAAAIQTADQISKRRTQAILDAADVMTPEQRAKAVERFSHHRGHRG